MDIGLQMVFTGYGWNDITDQQVEEWKKTHVDPRSMAAQYARAETTAFSFLPQSSGNDRAITCIVTELTEYSCGADVAMICW